MVCFVSMAGMGEGGVEREGVTWGEIGERIEW